MKKNVSLAALILLGSAFVLAQGQDAQVPPAAQSDKVKTTTNDQPVTGKTGQHATKLNTSTTHSTGEETPAFNTQNGIAQQPGKQTTNRQPPINPKPGPGAPPNWEQVGQEPGLADNSAAAASRAEIGGPEGTLGVSGSAPPENQAAVSKQNAASQKAQAAGANQPKGAQSKGSSVAPPQPR